MSGPNQQGSIRRRLLLSLMAGAAVLAVVVYFVVQSVARQVAQESQDNVLAASALSILDSARVSGGQVGVDFPYSALSMLDSVTDERVFYKIRLEDTFLSGYAELPSAQGDASDIPSYLSSNFLGVDVRVATVQRAVSTDVGQSFLQVSVAQTLTGQKETLSRISRTALAVGMGFFVVSALLAVLVAQSAIRPLDRLTISVSRRGPKDLRPVAAPVPSEMVPLVASLNSLMGRLQKSLTRSEEFIAEAAHRVRTPLAIVRTKAEIIARRSEDTATQEALSEMIHAIDDSSRTAGQLLDHAMVTFRLDHLLKEDISLPQLIKETVERLRPVADIKDIELRTGELPELSVKGDRILLQNALLNLLDNALKYAPSGAEVSVTLASKGSNSVIGISDSGPGFPNAELDLLTDRFARGQNAHGIVGSGLGLTIAKEVVEAHSGSLTISNSTGGGACVTLSFPSA
ncbi:two-component system sensor histidine kinase TctE [Shimia isoporae]|uniref:histidine kinase n=1 Tax=Shimia isoporae TaxID=647720 RepID=A0A4V6NFT3_9RHOB|nr:sensor histidine kinase [Shimia isoporae]TCL09890.1 two-component system sensor histidine kinase TctE [Shimia isoporae]